MFNFSRDRIINQLEQIRLKHVRREIKDIRSDIKHNIDAGFIWAYYLTEGTPEFGPGANFEPYISKGIICIDACTASTHKVNIVKLKDERLN